ncbi:hypothetical protein X975_26658, partial [Stegodyphus mimosarum]
MSKVLMSSKCSQRTSTHTTVQRCSTGGEMFSVRKTYNNHLLLLV